MWKWVARKISDSLDEYAAWPPDVRKRLRLSRPCVSQALRDLTAALAPGYPSSRASRREYGPRLYMVARYCGLAAENEGFAEEFRILWKL